LSSSSQPRELIVTSNSKYKSDLFFSEGR
jgi:hypothetical protein